MYRPTLRVPSSALRATSPRGVQTGDMTPVRGHRVYISINYRRRIAPWRETTKMSQKLNLSLHDGNFSQLCAAFGISRTTDKCHRHADKGSQDCRNCPGGRNRATGIDSERPASDLGWSQNSLVTQTSRYRPPVPLPLSAYRLSPNTPTPAVRRFEKAFPESWQVFKGHHATALAVATH